MTPGGADALKAAIKRSLPLIVALVILGVIAVNVFEHLQGSKYQASANVEINPTSLAEIVTGTTSPVLDPTEVLATAQTLAGAPQVYGLAAKQTNNRFGSAGDLSGATSVSQIGSTDLLSFTAVAKTPALAIGIANAAANAYTVYSARLTGSQIAATISQLQTTANALPVGGGQRTTIEGLIAKLQLLQGSAASGATVVETALSASLTSPKLTKDSEVGFAVGLIVALLLVALREAADTKVRSESDVEELLAVPVLASIRSLPRRAQIVTLGRHEPMYGDAYALLAAQLAPDRRENEHTVLAVTSALAGEGKTTTVANLAVSLARRGESVLLADFDFHRPTLASLFEIPHGVAGSLQILDRSETVDDTLWEVFLDGPKAVARRRAEPAIAAGSRRSSRAEPVTDPDSNGQTVTAGSLLILPSGKASGQDARARTANLGPLLRDLSARAEIVILDTPPALLTVEMTELSQLIDMVVVVVRQGRVSQRVLRSLGRRARTWPAELTGAVMTDVPASTTGYSSYYGGR